MSRILLQQTGVDEWRWYCFRLPPPLLRITKSLTFSAAAQDQPPISWQRRSKDQLASEGRRSLPTTDPPIRSPTFTARSGQIPTILRKITTSWKWLTSRDAASWKETWVIDRDFASRAGSSSHSRSALRVDKPNRLVNRYLRITSLLHN